MLRKVLCCILILTLGISQVSVGYGYDDDASRFLSAQTQLRDLSGGDTYIEQVDTIVSESSTEKLRKIQGRINSLDLDRNSTLSYIIYYLDASIYEELKDRITEVLISAEQQALAEIEVLSMQKQLTTSIKNILSQVLLNWEELSTYEEKGDFDMNISMNVEAIGNIDGGVSLNNYTAETQKFDQQLKGHINAFLQANVQGENTDVQLTSLVNFISQDGNMYILLKKLKLDGIEGSPFDEKGSQAIIEKIQELAKSDTYIKYTDKDSQAMIRLLENLSPNKFSEHLDMINSQALLEAYDIQDGNYILRPSKHFCDMGKTLSEIFDPFGGKDCTDNQYREMLLKMQKGGLVIALTPGANKRLHVSIAQEDIQADTIINWSSRGIIDIDLQAYDPKNKDENYFNFHFIPKKSFTSNFKVKDEVQAELSVAINRKGNISTVDFNLDTIEDEYSNSKFNANIQYKQNTLAVDVSAESRGLNLQCNIDGSIKKDSADLESMCTIVSPFIQYMFSGEDTFIIESELQVDTKYNNNNIKIDFDASVGENNTLHIDLSNTGTRKSIKASKIQVPTKIKEIEEIKEEVYAEMLEENLQK